MKNNLKDLLKVASVTALTLTVAAATFIGANNMAFAAATQTEIIPTTDDIKSSYQITDIADDAYEEPDLTIITSENLDANGKPYPNNIPRAGAMSKEEAAQIGARYIFEMYGESIDGKTVEMSYTAWPHSSRTYWHGDVADLADDLKPTEAVIAPEEGSTAAAIGAPREVLYSFSIDAVTGEWVSINPRLDIPEPEDLGEGKTYTLTLEEMEALQYEAPEEAEIYAEAAREFAQRHFKHSKVVSSEFHRISLNFGDGSDRAAAKERANSFREAYDADKPITFTLYEKGRSITFNVTDDTGRTAFILLDMDSKQVTFLDTSDSDFIPGYSYESIDGVG
jgi:hypothetical protein